MVATMPSPRFLAAGGSLMSSCRPSTSTMRAGVAGHAAFLKTIPMSRSSHIGSTPVEKPAAACLEILPFPPHPVPHRPLLPSLRRAQTMVVTGPKGMVVLPLHHCIKMSVIQPSQPADSASSVPAEESDNLGPELAPPTGVITPKDLNYREKVLGRQPVCLPATTEGEDTPSTRIRLNLRNLDGHKKEKGTWGLTRNILHNAFVGVTEGHTVLVRLVGVGFRAALELDPLPRQSKLDKALANRSYFFSPEAKQAEIDRDLALKEFALKSGPNMRLNIRLGYSHPVILPVPHGITCQVPQPTKIILTSADRELIGNFAAEIRRWRVPEPYKGKGIFIDNEIIRLKTVKKK